MLKTVRLRRINVWQAAKVSAVLYLLLSAIIMVPLGLFIGSMPGIEGAGSPFGAVLGGAMFFILPLFYGFFGFIFTAIFCALYNLVAGWTGGIEVQTQHLTDEDTYSIDAL